MLVWAGHLPQGKQPILGYTLQELPQLLVDQ